MLHAINVTLGKHKKHKVKRYSSKTLTSDEVRHGCLHYFLYYIAKPRAEISKTHLQPV